MTDIEKLLERLEAVESDYIGADLSRQWFRNPDGPEAAATIRRLRDGIACAHGMLASFAGQPNHMGDVFKVLDAALTGETGNVDN